jgi:hypothetical protein
MPATHQLSTERAAQVAGTTQYPTELHGQTRIAFFTHTQDGAGDATSSVALARLPPGRVRLLLSDSQAYVNWTTASATLDLGWDAYEALSDGASVTADPNGLVDGMDVDTVGIRQFSTGAVAGVLLTGYSYVFESRDGVVIRATSQDTAIVNGDDLVGYLTYVVG